MSNPFVPLPNEEYEVDIVYPQEHNGSGFCYDPTCPDKEDRDLIEQLNQAILGGLASTSDANRIYRGHTV